MRLNIKKCCKDVVRELASRIRFESENNKDKDKIKEYINELANYVEDYPKCTICGNPIYFPSMRFKICGDRLVFMAPKHFEHNFNGKIYKMDKCYECVCDHFKNDMPSSQRYLFQLRYRWAKYLYNIPEEEHLQIRSKMCGVTKENLIEKYGKEDGIKRWNEYCQKQSETNTFEYKQEKYGWTKEQFDEYNKSRAVTKENLIKRHGKKLGLDKWEAYCQKQSYNTTLPYFLEKYGNIEGAKRYYNFCEARVSQGGWGEKSYSKVSQQLFAKLYDKIKHLNHNIYFNDLNHEFYINTMDETNAKGYLLDFYDKTKNLIIEFQGDYWHCNPNIYDSQYINEAKNMTANEIWEYDNNKKLIIKDILKNPIYIEIWESDYYLNKDKIINDIVNKYYQE